MTKCRSFWDGGYVVVAVIRLCCDGVGYFAMVFWLCCDGIPVML